jgi:hypothetical protein
VWAPLPLVPILAHSQANRAGASRCDCLVEHEVLAVVHVTHLPHTMYMQ